ncbi:MAG TPA: DNA translocase FtsK 4TM domain-containing protein [Thermodesulfobacteriota bacterium]|nr:DNA translocase FtsK 4TM domain-containing protein [Thermodesulfobacteriota bacterium]
MGKAASSDRSNLKREVLGISLLALAVLLALSLFSFNPDDISFDNQPSEPQRTSNLAGVVGSYLADIFFQVFGLTAFLWPFALAFFALRLFRSSEISVSPLKAICWAGLFLAVSGLLSLGLGKVNLLGASMNSGGALGKILATTGERFLNLTGAVLLLALVLVVCMMVITNLSWVEVSNGIRQLYSSALERWQEFLKERRKRKKEEAREARRKEPVPAVIIEQQVGAPKEKPTVVLQEKQEHFPFLDSRGSYVLPPLSLLEDPEQKEVKVDKESLLANAKILEKRLSDFGVQGKVNEVRPGPVITMYEYEPAPGIKINKIVGLSDDLALALRAISVRIVAPIPGKAAVGIEIPNSIREPVYLKDILGVPEFQAFESKLTLALGKDIFGSSFLTSLQKMPHLLVAGATGTGKSVSLNSMICSILYKADPEEVKFLMIDPKRLELSIYEGIPHLLHSVVFDPKAAAMVLRWATQEMEVRYRLMAEKGVRNIERYNQKAEKEKKEHRKKPSLPIPQGGEGTNGQGGEPVQPLPYIVIVIDELADLMMVSARDVEASLTRLAQMARAAGIHLLLATQRPSVDVLTGVIKANFPTRISFQVSSKTDSRTILDANGAEHLLGSGDMLFLPPGTSRLVRVHGAYVSEVEILRVVEHWKKQGRPVYDPSILEAKEEAQETDADGYDEMYDQAVALVTETRQASISMIQRRLRVGYNRAARMIEKMEEEGVVGPADGSKPREVYMKKF